MSRRNGLAVVGIVLTVLLGAVVLRTPEPARGAPPERSFEAKAAIKVVMKNQMFEYMTFPEVRQLGGRAFVVGTRQGAPGTAWLPIDDVVFIEAYATYEDMLKVYPGLAKKTD
jgi:hypothetical protein